jgi:hypothetical protein
MPTLELIPKGVEEQQLFVERLMSDTGFFARKILGMDTDRGVDGVARGPVGKGGIRDYGKHQEMIDFLDDFSTKLKVLLAPRKSYKSSIVEALVLRVLLAKPNWCILLMMHDFDLAKQRVQTMRELLVENEIIQHFFGDPKSKPWRSDEFTTAYRTDRTLLDPSLKACSPGKMPTGGHYHLILLDDIVDFNKTVTPAAIQRSVDAARFVMGLRARDSVVVDVGTPYAEMDVHDFLRQRPRWKSLVLPVEQDPVEQNDGTLAVEGDSGWDHLDNEFLQEHLDMGYSYYMSQFRLKVVGGIHQTFKRAQFTPTKWRKEFEDLTGFLLCDVSTTENVENALNVIAYVGLDSQHRIYLLDMHIGRFAVHEFCDRWLSMKARWSAKVNHSCELMEVNATNNTYRVILAQKSKEQNIRLNIRSITRGNHDLAKKARISRLEPCFQAHEFFVCNDTVPKTWLNDGRIETMWDPEGYEDPDSGELLPAGELVSQFVRFPSHPLKDIPDAIADILTLDKQTQQRVCFWKKPLHKVDREATMRKSVAKRPGSRRASTGVRSRFYQRRRNQ